MPRLYLIDGHSYIYRAFFAVPYLSNAKGLPTNAVYGFARMVLKIINREQPEYLAVAFDRAEPTFRHQQYGEYKSHRPPMADDLVVQLPYIRQLVQALNIPTLELAGYEADDIICTLAHRAKSTGIQVVIVSADKDTFQLVDENTIVYDDIRDIRYDVEQVRQKYGVEPGQLPDVFGLAGDASDNVPGVPGIGLKTAAKLINEFGNLENLLANISKVKNSKQQENLKNNIEVATLSKRLVTVDCNVPLEVDFGGLARRQPDLPKLLPFFREMKFDSLLKEFSPAEESVSPCQCIMAEAEMTQLVNQLSQAKAMSIKIQTDSIHPLQAQIAGITMCVNQHEAYYIPLGHKSLSDPPVAPGFIPGWSGGGQAPCRGSSPALQTDYVLDRLKPFLQDGKITKYGHDLKHEWLVLRQAGITFRGLDFDTMVAAYLFNPSRRKHDLEDIALEYLGRKIAPLKELLGEGAGRKSWAEVGIEAAGNYNAQVVLAIAELSQHLHPNLKEAGLDRLFHEMEMPLVEVLAQMEYWGVSIDTGLLAQISQELDGQIAQLRQHIFALAGADFNPDSPKQLGYILFEKMGLPAIKKTKTGYSTDNEVLEELAMIHKLPATIVDYRRLTKLKNTYVDALPALINPQTRRLHTSLNQTITATGRLSSSEPNLQNIPIRTELGRHIRQAFIPAPGCVLLAADYSQIELRLMAHLSGDEAMIQSFLRGEDIHRRTAAEIFKVGLDQVNAEQRRLAKTINFGIMYGLSAYGLSKELKIGQKEAQTYIAEYFSRYPRIKEYIGQTISQAQKDGYVCTLLGRRRAIPELASANKTVRQLGERLAVNSPLQGTAADIIKLAMINIYNQLQNDRLRSKMILQVHDELLFEVPQAELLIMQPLVTQQMQEVITLSVPLVVNLKLGKNWAEVE